MTTDIVKFRDFTLSSEPIRFKIDEDVFDCLPEIPLDVLGDMATLASGDATGARVLGRFYDLLDGFLMPESAERFRRRGRKSTREDPNPDPIGMRHIREILPWLMEVYGLRPTRPSDESSAGSSDVATSLTDGA